MEAARKTSPRSLHYDAELARGAAEVEAMLIANLVRLREREGRDGASRTEFLA